MESKAKILGHPIHQILIVFPLGLLSTSLVFDGMRLVTGNRRCGLVARAMIGSGLVGGLLAAPFGLWDYLHIPVGTRASRVGLKHGLSNLGTMTLFGLSYVLRRRDPEKVRVSALVLSGLGGIGALVGGWLGGELVDRLGIGVSDGANVNAESSLREVFGFTPPPTPGGNGQQRVS